MTLTVGSLFSGIGGIDLACERAGMRVAWQVEIDATCRRVLAKHWPDVKRETDVCDVGAATLDPVDVLAGGFPCQDLSVAGRRAGLAGARSGLWWEFARLVDELRPRWVVVENVPGLLSSNDGRDMGAILWTLGELGFWWSYRVLDAQYDGVAQRRRRVFIVGHSGERAAPATVLFELERLCGDSPPSREAREEVAGTIGGGPGERGWSSDTDRMTFVAGTVSSKWAKGTGGPAGDEVQNLVAFDTQQITSKTNRSRVQGGPVPTLNQSGQMHVAHAITANGADGSEDGTGCGTPLVAIPLLEIGARTNGDGERDGDGIGKNGDPMFTLQAGKQHGIANNMTVRRLTPLECERLQGLPDDWTRYGQDERELSDSARYRMIGNGVAVPVVEWIARRIVAFDAATEATP